MADIIQAFKERGERQANSSFSFVTDDFLNNVPFASENELNQKDFGIVKLDDRGNVLFYNDYESKLAGIKKEDAIGKNFFTDVAPCTNNGLFMGSYKDGVEQNKLKILFFYTFTYRMAPTNVKVFLWRHPGSSTNWIFIKGR